MKIYKRQVKYIKWLDSGHYCNKIEETPWYDEEKAPNIEIGYISSCVEWREYERFVEIGNCSEYVI